MNRRVVVVLQPVERHRIGADGPHTPGLQQRSRRLRQVWRHHDQWKRIHLVSLEFLPQLLFRFASPRPRPNRCAVALDQLDGGHQPRTSTDPGCEGKHTCPSL